MKECVERVERVGNYKKNTCIDYYILLNALRQKDERGSCANNIVYECERKTNVIENKKSTKRHCKIITIQFED